MAISKEEKARRIANRQRLNKCGNAFLININQLIKKTPVYVDLANQLSIPFKTINRRDLWVENDHVTLVNCFTQKPEKIPVGQIVGYRYMGIRTEPSKERTENFISRDLEQIQQCVDDETIDLSFEEIINKYCVKNQTTQEWEIQKLFKLKYDIDQLKNPDDSIMSDVRNIYMDIIRSHREKSFEELDQLEQQTKEQQATDEDLDDINTIKQMFRDIPQDSDLSEYKTVHEMLQFWPSLLLPKPDILPTQSDIDILKPAPQLSELYNMLMKIHDAMELRSFFTEMKSSIGVDSIPEDAIKMVKDRIRMIEWTQDIKKL